MSRKKNEKSKKKSEETATDDSFRKVYTFTLHSEDDADIMAFLAEKKITRSVKQGLRMLMQKEERENQGYSKNEGADPQEIAKAVLQMLSEQGVAFTDKQTEHETSVSSQEDLPSQEEAKSDLDKKFEEEFPEGLAIPGLNFQQN